MPESKPHNESPKAISRKRPVWRRHLEKRYGKLHDAVSLSMNTSPSSMRKLISLDKKVGSVYRNRLDLARSECVSGGRIAVVERGQKEDGSDWFVDLRSFVAYAETISAWKLTDQFKLLGTHEPATPSGSDSAKAKRKTPDSFVVALMKLLVEISRRAALQKQDFSIDAMPGEKVDLYKIAKHFDIDLRVKESSFATYVKGLIQFKQGAGSSDFYDTLFPELAAREASTTS
jgi:hypothetical protein